MVEWRMAPEVTWMTPYLPKLLQNGIIPLEVGKVLDLGCGKGIFGAMMRNYRHPTDLVGVDVFGPYLEHCRRWRYYDRVIDVDLSIGQLPFGNDEFDLVVCLETIEHLEPYMVWDIVREMERVAKRVVVGAPNGFWPQDELDGNPWQIHFATLHARDFKRRGYRVIGVGKLRLPIPAFEMEVLGHAFPNMCEQFLAVKEMIR